MKIFINSLFSLLLLLSIFVITITSSFAQEQLKTQQLLPYHIDPNSKIEAPDLTAVPAIRFLTSTDFFPFNYRNNSNRLMGYNIDLAKEICTILDIVCTMQAWPWEKAKNALIDNQGDVLIAGLAISKDSVQKLDFSNIYLMLPARFVTLKSNNTKIDLNDLAKQKIAIKENSKHLDFFKKYFKGADIIEYKNDQQALNALKNGTVSLYFGDAMLASFWLNENIDCCTFIGDPYFNSDYFGQGLALALPAGRDKTRSAINYALTQLKRNGKLDELYLRWFPISFY